ncbi:glycosyltransferase [Mesorhizobium sp.]|uniref:glycosyltransferase n=1 Tax=Mesorhizobium sp. TaxID=1871066 RepID=UPI000FE3E55D|nr:glycosyltransferase [Mesorhizobium sp.]RWA70961.1 MAG: glycosyltransferase [Mesorhizobium sp.]RWB99291.1 MAG: glycosyltransferase [Mesorhizobium sp.]RWG81673.1 MAG: glycosyltransferase [Mesorhizobium sp.]RWG83314.1 MAG: glycosyltransferase [Mesorhizobium sp.]RWK08256.1 MAG: glycosyltransferase [Mesorhizobium sp.]
MRILYFIYGFDPGGAEHGLLNLLRAGFFSGHQMKILACCRGRGGALADEIAAQIGEQNFILTSQSEVTSLRNFVGSFFVVLRLIWEWRPDMVALSLKQANLLGRLAAMFAPQLHCVSFEHTARYRYRSRRAAAVYGPVLKALSWRVDEIWADCESTLQQTQVYFLPRRRRLHIVPLFCSDEASNYKRDYALHTPLRLAAAGRLIPLKNFDRLIEAIRMLQDRNVSASLDLYGDGPERHALSRKADELGIGDRVHFHGYVARWFELACDCDMFINMSDTEGFCIVVAEAMLAGLPVIATDVGGIRDYGKDGENMLKLTVPSAEMAVAQALMFVDDETLRKKIGMQARQDMLQAYSQGALRVRAAAVLGGGL